MGTGLRAKRGYRTERLPRPLRAVVARRVRQACPRRLSRRTRAACARGCRRCAASTAPTADASCTSASRARRPWPCSRCLGRRERGGAGQARLRHSRAAPARSAHSFTGSARCSAPSSLLARTRSIADAHWRTRARGRRPRAKRRVPARPAHLARCLWRRARARDVECSSELTSRAQTTLHVLHRHACAATACAAVSCKRRCTCAGVQLECGNEACNLGGLALPAQTRRMMVRKSVPRRKPHSGSNSGATR